MCAGCSPRVPPAAPMIVQMGAGPQPARRSTLQKPVKAVPVPRAGWLGPGVWHGCRGARPPARISLIDRQGGLHMSPTFTRGAALAVALAASLTATGPAAHAAPSAAARLATV